MSDQSPENSPHDDHRAADSPADDSLLFRVSDAKFLISFAVLASVLFGIHCVRRSGWGRSPVEIWRVDATEIDYRLDINQSSWVEWAQLPNIGETTARRIIADRETNGPFSSVDDVARVSGIGPRTLDALRQWLTADADSDTHLAVQ